jgi:hypothetical protein
MTRTGHRAVLAGGFIASTLVYLEVFGPYLTYKGEPAAVQFLKIFLFPITAATIDRLLSSLQMRQPERDGDPAPDNAVTAIVFWIILFLMGIHAFVLSVLLRVGIVEPWATRGVVVLLGLTIVAIGNLLPRTRPNIAVGIRTSRTLTDRRLWMLTHRATGYLAVAVGAITIVSGAVGAGARVAGVPAVSMLAAATILFVYYRRAVRA